jgi:hypothetical protein
MGLVLYGYVRYYDQTSPDEKKKNKSNNSPDESKHKFKHSAS